MKVLSVGIDEVGRGPLMGPVTACAVIFPPDYVFTTDYKDSKSLSEKRREFLAEKIRIEALSFSIIHVGSKRIDILNIREATKLAMRLAASKAISKIDQDILSNYSPKLLIDGNMKCGTEFEEEPIIKGDALIPIIGAASILAKVERDNLMKELSARFPGYGIEKHKGYPTAQHREAIKNLGATYLHRKSFSWETSSKADSKIKLSITEDLSL